jgi:hypothetical protein
VNLEGIAGCPAQNTQIWTLFTLCRRAHLILQIDGATRSRLRPPGHVDEVEDHIDDPRHNVRSDGGGCAAADSWRPAWHRQGRLATSTVWSWPES